MKYHVEIGHFTKYNAFRVNRDKVMDLEIRFKIHTNVSVLLSVYRFVKIGNSFQFPAENQNGHFTFKWQGKPL